MAVRKEPFNTFRRNLANKSTIVLNIDSNMDKAKRTAGLPGSINKPNTSLAKGGDPLCANSSAS